MILFDNFSEALEEAVWCANEERDKYFIRMKGGKYIVRKKSGGVRLAQSHIEVGFKHFKRGRKADV